MNRLEYRSLDSDQRFKVTEYFIEASHEETMGIWRSFVDHPYKNCRPLNWEQLDGMMYTVANVSIQYDDTGEIKRMPICVSIMWNLVDGHLMAFYEACSQVVDHDIVKKFIDEKSNSNVNIRTNSSNFHHALHHCNIDINKKETEFSPCKICIDDP